MSRWLVRIGFTLAALATCVAEVSSQNGSPAGVPTFAEPGISPDHSEIAFVSGGDIWTVPSSGGCGSDAGVAVGLVRRVQNSHRRPVGAGHAAMPGIAMRTVPRPPARRLAYSRGTEQNGRLRALFSTRARSTSRLRSLICPVGWSASGLPSAPSLRV